MTVVVKVGDDVPDKLKAAARAHRQLEKTWLYHQRTVRRLSGRSRRVRVETAALRRELQELRAAGVLRGTIASLVGSCLEETLVDNGWAGDHPAIPPGGLTAGRPWGHSHTRGTRGPFDARVSLAVDAATIDRVARAAYWTSRSAVTFLQEWYDRWGDGHIGAERLAEEAPDADDVTELASTEAIAQRDRARQRVITTGDIWRATIDAALAQPVPPAPPTNLAAIPDWLAHHVTT